MARLITKIFSLIALVILAAFHFAGQSQANSLIGGGHALIGGNAVLTTGLGSSAASGTVAINDLGTSTYQGLYQGGFYPNGLNAVPSGHDTDGLAFAGQIQRLSTSGAPSASGKIILMSAGMSVALGEFSVFIQTANATGQVASSVVMNNQAVSNNDLPLWFPGTAGVSPTACTVSGNQCSFPSGAANEYDRICNNLPNNSMSCNQAQAMWIDQSNGVVHQYENGCWSSGSGSSTVYTKCNPLNTTSTSNNTIQNTDAYNVEWELGQMMRSASGRMPNLKLAFFSSRVYGGYCKIGCADPEPVDYEKAFAIKWLIEAQINEVTAYQNNTNIGAAVIDSVAGDLCYLSTGCGPGSSASVVPWLGWADAEPSQSDDAQLYSAYFWANGNTPRVADGLTWCHGSITPQAAPCGSTEHFSSPDWLHLSAAGATQAGTLLSNFFLHSKYTKPWFHK
jgi:hypothetical protein